MTAVKVQGLPAVVSGIVLGMMKATPADRDRTFALLDAYVRAGGNMVDTAHVYGAGDADRAIGEWLGVRGRETVMVLAKGCHPHDDGIPRVSPAAMSADLDESLERLGSGYVDLFVLHRDDPAMPVGALIDALNAKLDDGRIRAFGASNWRPERIAEANAYAAANGLTPLAVNNPGWSLAAVVAPPEGLVYADDECREFHRTTQLPLFAWSAQAGGFFSGKYAAGDGQTGDVTTQYYTEENFRRLARARLLAERTGLTPNAIAVAYVLNQPFPAAAVVGPNTVAQLEDSLTATCAELSPADITFLETGRA